MGKDHEPKKQLGRRGAIVVGAGIGAAGYLLHRSPRISLQENPPTGTPQIEAPQIPNPQYYPGEQREFFKKDFEDLFARLRIHDLLSSFSSETQLFHSIIEGLEKRTLSDDASTLHYAPGSNRVGSQRTLFLDSQNFEWAVQATARIQGGGYDPIIGLERHDYAALTLLGRRTRRAFEVLFVDRADEPLVLRRKDNLSAAIVTAWDRGELTPFTIDRSDQFTLEDFETMRDILDHGNVNIPLTERFILNLDEEWNTPPEQPLKLYSA